jgi:phenylacetate-coenzyme A ligase PaaK-like adenylate-forming protein
MTGRHGRLAAESTFGASVVNWWVSTEAGPMGIGCGHGPGMHLSDDLIIVEPVDEAGQPVPDDSFRYDGVVVHPHVFRSVLGRTRGIIEYRVIQTERGARVEIRGLADHRRLRRQLTDALAKLGLNQPEVSIAAAGAFERQETGKVKRFIALSDSLAIADEKLLAEA